MPKGRMLNKKISLDEQVALLSDKAIILYCWSISHLDSEGKMHASNAILKGTIVPYLKRFTHQVIGRIKTELGNSPLVIIYGNGKYMKFMGFEKNQRIDKDREAPSEIPDPTPEELQSKSRGTPSKVKLSLSKDNSKQPSPALQAALDKVYKDKFNIYALIARVKKRLSKDTEFPEEVLLHVCDAYQRDKAKIKKPWPWFIRVLETESGLWCAQQQINKNDKRGKWALTIGDILKKI